jgi:hypothetical protein
MPAKPVHPTWEAHEGKQLPKSFPNFKLDLSKCSNVEDSVRTVDHEADILLDFKDSSNRDENFHLVCTPKKSKRQEEEIDEEKQQSPKHQVHIVRRQHA